MTEHAEFNSTKIFTTLFVLTAVEVAWSFIPFPKWALWGGLLVFALWKGILIFMYFMHMKFEGWVVKALIAPTPLLIAIVLFATMPDVANNSLLMQPIATQVNPEDGKMRSVADHSYVPGHEGEGGEEGDGH